MKAVALTANGDLDCLEVMDLPKPEPVAGEVRIALKTAALNHLDVWIRLGRPGSGMQFPHIQGSDAAGVVDAVGEGVEQWKVGDEVVVNPGLSCGLCEACQKGQHSECQDFGLLGVGRPGTYAEYLTVPEVNVQPKPAYLSWEEAAAFPLAYVTAFRMLMSRAVLRPGESVLIHGIGGGVALAALQLATRAGASCIVTSSSDDKLARAKELGAVAGVNYSQSESVAKDVLQLTDGRGVDVIVDSVGGATWPINMEATRKGGRITHCGVTGGPKTEANVNPIYWRQLNILGSTMGSQDDFRQLIRMLETTQIHPIIDQVFALDNAREAQGRMERGEQFGKIVLSMG